MIIDYLMSVNKLYDVTEASFVDDDDDVMTEVMIRHFLMNSNVMRYYYAQRRLMGI